MVQPFYIVVILLFFSPATKNNILEQWNIFMNVDIIFSTTLLHSSLPIIQKMIGPGSHFKKRSSTKKKVL